jgi:hypothetical protein
MATQTINFPFIAGQTGLSIRLRSLVDRSIVDTQSSSESTANNGVQTASFTDAPAAKYLVQLISGTTVLADDTVTLTLTTAAFWVDRVNGADTILSRNVSNIETTMPEHCLGTIILAMLEHSISGSTLTIKGTDGSTTRFTKTLTTNASADPITGIQ